MRPWERLSFNVLTAVVTVTGLAYLYMKFFMQTDDPFAIVNHPWQSSTLAAHVIVAPLLMLFFGMLLRSHTLKKLASPVPGNRRTGWMSLISFGSMAFSGYLLQVVTSPAWIEVLVVTHIATSLIFAVGYMVHLVIGWRMSSATSAAVTEQVPDTARLLS